MDEIAGRQIGFAEAALTIQSGRMLPTRTMGKFVVVDFAGDGRAHVVREDDDAGYGG